MKIGICSDHAGFDYKTAIIEYLKAKGFKIKDFGCFSKESMDYTDVAHPLARAVLSSEVDKGVALCGTGNGMAMTLNKHLGIRAGLAWNKEIAELIKKHNDANILVMPARFISQFQCLELVQTWLDCEFEGGRHQCRIGKIDSVD